MGAYRSPGAWGPGRQTLPHAARVSSGAECRGSQHARSLRCRGTLMSVCPSQYLPQAALCLQPPQRLPPGSSMETGSIYLKTKALKSTVLLSGSKSIHFIHLSLELRPQESWGTGVWSAAFGVEGRDWGRTVTAAFVEAPPKHPRNSGTRCPGAGSVLRFPGIQPPAALLSGVP